MHKYKKLVLALLAIVGILLLIAGLRTALHHEESPKPTSTSQTPQQSSNSQPDFDKKQHSTEDPESIWVVVNKKRPLPKGYKPSDLTAVQGQQLRKEAAAQLQILLDKAQSESTPMKVISGFRSYDSQTSVYNSYVKRDGQAAADRYSARPGYSEHQTGLAADLGASNGTCDLEICFETTTAGQWLAAHAYEYGFIIRYQKNNESLTGYQYEPWHIRYVGKELASELHKTGQTMEQFFDLPIATSY